MKRFGLFLVIASASLFVGPARGTSQMVMGGSGWQDAMCKRMCGQLGKKSQVCGKDGKTYDNSCTAKCDKVSYKRGACPEKEEKKDEGMPIVSLTEEDAAMAMEAEDQRPGGVVKFFDWDKGFGAITGDEGQELYVDASAVTGDAVETLKEGDRVKFDVAPGPKGMHANKVAFELTDEQKKAKLEQAVGLQMVEEQKPQTLTGSSKMMLQETASKDGVYVLPTR